MAEPLQITVDGKPWLTFEWEDVQDTGKVFETLQAGARPGGGPPYWHPDLVAALLQLVRLAYLQRQDGIAFGSRVFTFLTGNDDGPVFEIGWCKGEEAA
jgi:hypothetical protein